MAAPDEAQRPSQESRPDHLLPANASAPPRESSEGAEVGRRRLAGRLIGTTIVLVTVILLFLVAHVNAVDPRTQDASIGADYIGLAPDVSGRVIALHVSENSCVQRGQLLAEIDSKDYQLRLRQAIASRDDLDAQIADRRRNINADLNEVRSSHDTLRDSRLTVQSDEDRVTSSAADVGKRVVALDEARNNYATAKLTVERNRPLAERRYISPQEFDQYLGAMDGAAKQIKSAEQDLTSSQANEDTSIVTRRQGSIDVDKAAAAMRRDEWSVRTMDTLIAERPNRQAAVDQAQLNVERTRVFAPVSGCVFALSITQGAYAQAGAPLFTLVDSDSWYVVADYRESELKHIYPKMKAEVVLMSDPGHALEGSVQSIGSAVQSSDSTSLGGTPGSPGSLPNVERSLNWVRLAARYPVRIRFKPRDPSTLRIGTTVVVKLRD